MSLPDDTDYLCNVGGIRKTHFLAGPDKNQKFDPSRLGHDPQGGYATYNGHPVTTRNCRKHTHEFIEAARHYAVERHKKYGTAQQRADAAEREGRPITQVPEDEDNA